MSLNHKDLSGTILPFISIDEFEPKAGKIKDVIVVAFYLKDKDPADDLNTFIQRSFIDTLDVDVSPSTDDDGHYLVFVELSRNDNFPNKFQALLKDVKNVAGDLDWEVVTYLSDDKKFKFNDPELFNYVILQPSEYISKEKFRTNNLEESINQFFQNSSLTHLTLNNNILIIKHSNKKIVSEVIDIGDYDTVMARNFLNESAFNMNGNLYETRLLENIIGNCQILPIDEYICININDQIILLKNIQLDYE